MKSKSHLSANIRPTFATGRALRTLAICAVVVATWGAGPTALSAPVINVVATDSFDYASGNAITGQSGGSGWASDWESASSSFGDFSTAALGLSLPGVGGFGGKLTYRAGTQINDAARNLPLQSSGVVFIQFLAQFGAASSGGTPTIRLMSSGALTGGVGNNGGCGSAVFAILNKSLNAVACTAVPLSTLSAIVLRIDYSANTTRLWALPDLTGFDYLNPPAPSAQYTGLAPAFNRIEIYSRSPANLDELQVFRVTAAPAVPVAAAAIPSSSPRMLALGSVLLLLVAGAQRSRKKACRS